MDPSRPRRDLASQGVPWRPAAIAPRIVVLGGSGPFCVGLADAIATTADVPPAELVLVGRSRRALELVTSYTHALLTPVGWRVSAETDLARALAGADVVVNLIRYGGLEGRQRDERLAADLGVPADETVGPAGLAAAIRTAPGHRGLADVLASRSPDALVLNMANPLACSTALLRRGGVERAVGLCELPLVTVRQACRVLAVSPDEVEWRTAGLNHRSFIHVLRHRGRDLLGGLPDALGDGDLGGITAADIASLHAIPMKHFALGRRRPRSTATRAAELAATRAAILDELRADPTRPPPSLRDRPQPWYADALVPMLAAIRRPRPRELVVNLPAADGVVREIHARVSADGVVPTPSTPTTTDVSWWIDRFAEHERRIVVAASDPRPETVRAALAADPLVPVDDLDTAAERVLADVPPRAGRRAAHTSGIDSS